MRILKINPTRHELQVKAEPWGPNKKNIYMGGDTLEIDGNHPGYSIRFRVDGRKAAQLATYFADVAIALGYPKRRRK